MESRCSDDRRAVRTTRAIRSTLIGALVWGSPTGRPVFGSTCCVWITHFLPTSGSLFWGGGRAGPHLCGPTMRPRGSPVLHVSGLAGAEAVFVRPRDGPSPAARILESGWRAPRPAGAAVLFGAAPGRWGSYPSLVDPRLRAWNSAHTVRPAGCAVCTRERVQEQGAIGRRAGYSHPTSPVRFPRSLCGCPRRPVRFSGTAAGHNPRWFPQ